MNKDYTNVLGVKVNSTTYTSTLKSIDKWVKTYARKYICVSNVHSIMECQKDPRLLKGVNNAAIVTADGMPLVWLSNLYGRKAERVYGPTLTLKLCNLAEKKGYKVFFLGGRKGISKKLSKKLKKMYPNMKVVGLMETQDLPLNKSDNKKIVNSINKLDPQIVFVGMGCPTQERWMIDNRTQLKPNVLLGVGAAFDFIGGRVKQAPSWMQNGGMEWLYRLSQDPKRLWKRYTIMNAQFVYLVTRQILTTLLSKNPTSSARF